MSVEQMQIPVAEMETIEQPETKYAIAPDGTVMEAGSLQENIESLQEKMQ